MHEKILSLHSVGMSYKWVRDNQTHISSVAMKEVRPPNCWVSADSLTFAVGADSLHIDHLRQAIPKIMEDIWELYDELVGGRRFVSIPMKDIVDDMSNEDRDYSFLSHEPFASRKHDCFNHVVALHHLCMVDGRQRISWNHPGIDRFLFTSAKMWRLVGYLLSFTAQISIRTAQFMETTFINADRMRSFVWQCGEALLMGGWSKTSHITDEDRFLPAFIAELVAVIILELIGSGLREAESLLVLAKTKDQTKAQVHRT